jgi:hypothetical protein
MKFDANRATDLLISNIDRISVQRVQQQLKNEKKLLLQYLHSLFYKETRSFPLETPS